MRFGPKLINSPILLMGQNHVYLLLQVHGGVPASADDVVEAYVFSRKERDDSTSKVEGKVVNYLT